MDALVREQADEEALRKIFEELEFRTLIDRIFKKTISLSPLLPDLFLHKQTLRFKAIYSQNLRPTGQLKRKKRIYTR